MRIVFDVQVLQTTTRRRGMGRYSLNLLREFTRLRPEHEYVLACNAKLEPLESEDLLDLPFPVAYLKYGPESLVNREVLASFLEGCRCDLYVVCSPFESYGAAIPNLVGLSRAKTCAIVYDIIPRVFPEHYLPHPASRTYYASKMKLLTGLDFMLSISDCTREDVVQHLGVSPRVIGNIGGGVDEYFFATDAGAPQPPISGHIARLASLKCILYLGGQDWRKNEFTLIEAFAQLPAELRARHPLVFTHTAPQDFIDKYYTRARELGVQDQFHHTGTVFVTDHELKLLYQSCHLFIFPSLYEGYGLPIAEAMVCGAPVIAANNSSMPEVCGEAALMIDNPGDPKEITAQLQKVLENEDLRLDLKRRSLERREYFRWSHVVERMDAQLQRWMGNGSRTGSGIYDQQGSKKRRIALFAPLPPIDSDIAEYTADLLPCLGAHFEIDLFVDEGYSPDQEDKRLVGCRIFDHRRFPELMDSERYAVVNHQIGNSEFHVYQLEWLLRYPAVVTLHERNLAGLLHHLENKFPGRYPHLAIRGVLEAELGVGHAAEVLPEFSGGKSKGTKSAENGVYFSEFVLRYADGVILHSPSDLESINLRRGMEDAPLHCIPQHHAPEVIASRYRQVFDSVDVSAMIHYRKQWLGVAARLDGSLNPSAAESIADAFCSGKSVTRHDWWNATDPA